MNILIVEDDLEERKSLVQQVQSLGYEVNTCIDAAEVGKTGVELGGGRQQKGDPIDYSVGIICHAKIGTQLADGD